MWVIILAKKNRADQNYGTVFRRNTGVLIAGHTGL